MTVLVQPSPFETYIESPQPHIAPAEVYFDELITRGRFDHADEFVAEFVDDLQQESEQYGYDSLYFHVLLKQLAIPMYRKLYCDIQEMQYPQSRSDISGLFVGASKLMNTLNDFEGTEDVFFSRMESESHKDLRGNKSELTIFGLMAAPMTGFADDYTIMPSAATEDRMELNPDGSRSSYDFLVHDRDKDSFIKLQVKTQPSPFVYSSDITVLTLSSIAERAGTTIVELQDAIAANDRKHPAIERALSAIYDTLSDKEK